MALICPLYGDPGYIFFASLVTFFSIGSIVNIQIPLVYRLI